jgi:uncharacterized cupin superfamily protein
MQINILNESDGISVVKDNKTEVNYFIFDEYEIHLCRIPPHSAQEWHSHKVVEENIVVTQGEITVCWHEYGKNEKRVLGKNMIVDVKKSIHTIKNESDDFAEFVVLRLIPDGTSKKEIIKNDKIMYDNIE